MALTYGDMQTRIANELHRSDLATNNHITNAIKSAIRHYERERWYFNETTTSASLTTVASTATYALPANFMEMDNVMLTQGGWKHRLDPVAYIELDSIDAGSTSLNGVPRNYAIFGNLLRHYPVPDAAYTTTISYQKRLTELSASTDTNEWVDDFEQLIREKAKEILNRDVINNYEAADRIAQNIERSTYPRMRAESDKRLMSGKLTIRGW